MNSSATDEGRPVDIEQLLRLREVHVKKAAEKLHEQRQVHDEATQAAKASIRKLTEAREAVRQFAQHTVGDGAGQLARYGAWFQSYKELLRATAVRSQNAVVRDQNILVKCKAELRGAHAAWLHEIARRDGVTLALQRSRAAESREVERRAEEELDELPRRPPTLGALALVRGTNQGRRS